MKEFARRTEKMNKESLQKSLELKRKNEKEHIENLKQKLHDEQ